MIQHDAIPSFKRYNGFRGSILYICERIFVHDIPGNHVSKEGDHTLLMITRYHGDHEVKGFRNEDHHLLILRRLNERKNLLITSFNLVSVFQIPPGDLNVC